MWGACRQNLLVWKMKRLTYHKSKDGSWGVGRKLEWMADKKKPKPNWWCNQLVVVLLSFFWPLVLSTTLLPSIPQLPFLGSIVSQSFILFFTLTGPVYRPPTPVQPPLPYGDVLAPARTVSPFLLYFFHTPQTPDSVCRPTLSMPSMLWWHTTTTSAATAALPQMVSHFLPFFFHTSDSQFCMQAHIANAWYQHQQDGYGTPPSHDTWRDSDMMSNMVCSSSFYHWYVLLLSQMAALPTSKSVQGVCVWHNRCKGHSGYHHLSSFYHWYVLLPSQMAALSTSKSAWGVHVQRNHCEGCSGYHHSSSFYHQYQWAWWCCCWTQVDVDSQSRVACIIPW